MIDSINSSQKIFAHQLQCSLYKQLKCGNTPYTEKNYYLSFLEVKYCATATLKSMDTPPDPIHMRNCITTVIPVPLRQKGHRKVSRNFIKQVICSSWCLFHVFNTSFLSQYLALLPCALLLGYF